MKEFVVDAKMDNLESITNFVTQHVDKELCGEKDLCNIHLIVEEVFSNIVRYAYPSNEGKVTIKCEQRGDPSGIYLEFIDMGFAYNPLKSKDPEISLLVEERDTGGLGIFLIKKLCDKIEYEYVEGKNILRLKKFYK